MAEKGGGGPGSSRARRDERKKGKTKEKRRIDLVPYGERAGALAKLTGGRENEENEGEEGKEASCALREAATGRGMKIARTEQSER